jgi:glycosyltransferase involved in cell wall biosynthesis
MKNTCFCSFIVAVYNREKYVEQCLRSILYQTCTDFEIIVVDDGSTDKSLATIKAINHHKIKIFEKVHTGCWPTMNYGVKHATGDFVCFIGSDDFISSDFLSNSIDTINHNPLFDYYYPTALHICNEDGSPTNSIWRYVAYELSERKNLIKLFWDYQIGGIPQAGALIRREIFDKYGLFNDTFFNLADTAYIISNAMKIKFLMVPELKTYYNRQHQNQTNKNESEKMRTFSEILDEIIEKYPTEFFLSKNIDKNEPDFYQHCVDKFMSLAERAKYKEHYHEKAKKYLKLLRSTNQKVYM